MGGSGLDAKGSEGNVKMGVVRGESVFIFVLLGKNIGRQTATRIHEQRA